MASFKILFNFFFIYLLLVLSVTCNAQSAGDYRSNSILMNWDTPTDWQTWDIASSSWITAGVAPDASQAFISIQQGHTVLLTTAHTIDQLIVNGTLKNTSAALTINDGPGDDLTIHTGAKIVNEGTNATINNLGKLIMNDSIINKITCTFINKGLLINDHAYFKNTGKLINQASSVISNNGDFLTGGSISFEKGSLYQHNFPSTQPTAGTIPTANWKNGSTCEVLACGNAFQPGALNQIFHHFIWNNSTQPHDFNLTANPNIINGNFEIKNTNEKKLAYKGSSSGDLSIADSFKITGGIVVLTNGSASTVVNTSTYYQQGGTLDMSASGSASSIFITSSFTHTGGILQRSGTAASNTITINGTSPSTLESIGFRTGDPIIFKINKEATTGSCMIPVSKTFIVHTGTSFNLLDNTTLSSDLQIDGTFSGITNTWNLTQGITSVNGNFINHSILPVNMNSNSVSLQFKPNSVYTHAGNGGEVVNAAWSPASTLHITGIETATVLKNGGQYFGTILWDCKNQQQSCIFGLAGFGVQGNFIVESTGVEMLRFPDCDFTINGGLTVRNDARLQLSAAEGLYDPLQRIITINGTVSVLQTAILQVGKPNTSNTATSSTDQFRDYNLQLKKDFIYTSTTPLISYHHKNYPGNNNDNVYHLSLTFNGNTVQHLIMKKQLTDLVHLSPTEYIANNFYKLIISGKGTHLVPQLNDLKVHEIQVDEGDTLTIGLEDINIIQYPILSYIGSLVPPSFDLYGTLDLGMNLLSDGNSKGLFHVQPGATILTKHFEGIDQDAASGCIQSTGERIFDAAAHYVYNGTSNQVTGTGLPSILSGSLTIDNSASPALGGITLTKNTTIDGILYLTNGKLHTTPSNTLTIGKTGTVFPTGGQAFSFIDGPIKKTGLIAGDEFIFPTGNKNKWARLGITSGGSSIGEFTAAYVVGNPVTISNSLLDLDHISTKEYWKLDKTNPVGALSVRLFWESGNYSGIYSTNPADLKIAHDDGSTNTDHKWRTEENNLIIDGNAATGSIRSTVSLSDLNLFTFGSTTSINPLPVNLLSFTGYGTPKGNVLNWTTASEQNNHFFCIQRSSNGNQFSQIGMVNGHGTSSNLQYYAFTDSLISTNPVYYRLKQTDNDGKFTYSLIIRIEPAMRDLQEVIAYPNPATTNDIHIITSGTVQSFRIYNLLGKIVFENHSTNENSEHVFTTDTAGIYLIKVIMADGKIITKRIIKS
jgi:hypothetical protein